jgi:hypothetical protein
MVTNPRKKTDLGSPDWKNSDDNRYHTHGVYYDQQKIRENEKKETLRTFPWPNGLL